MGQNGTDNMSLEGNGALTVNANCIGGTIALRGNFKITDNSGGAVTLVKDDKYNDLSDGKAKTDQFVFTVPNQVDANSLTGGLSEAQVRDAVGLASANLDTQLADLPTSAEIATEILAAGDVDGYSLEETLKLCLAALAGKISGAGSGTITIRSADDSADRIVATTDNLGNRLSITIDEAG
jgi:mevalonate kinase